MLHKKKKREIPIVLFVYSPIEIPEKIGKNGTKLRKGGGEIGNFVLFFCCYWESLTWKAPTAWGCLGWVNNLLEQLNSSLDFSSERKYIALPNLDSSSVEKSRRKRLKKEKSLEMLIVCLIHTYPLVKKTDFLFSPICHKKHYNFGQIC